MDLVELCKRDHTQKKSPQNVVYCVVFSLCFIVNKICRVLLNSSWSWNGNGSMNKSNETS